MRIPTEKRIAGRPELADGVQRIDGGAAPIEHIMRLSGAAASVAPTSGGSRAKAAVLVPLNPLRAGAAAARKERDTVLRKTNTVDAGPATGIPARAASRRDTDTRKKTARTKARRRRK